MALDSSEAYKVKDLTEWTACDVRDFIQAVLPGHPCVEFFAYTTGYVLNCMEKDDLRRQAKDDEAANVIWAELSMCKRAHASGFSVPRGRFQARQHIDKGVEGPPLLSVYVRTQQGVAMELQAVASDAVITLKTQIAEKEGTPVENQRLITSGMNMQDDRTLQSYGVRTGTVILLVPQLRSEGRPMTFASRGPLMVPASQVWAPSHPVRPYLPVLCRDVSRGFPISMEFGCAEDVEAFAAAVREEAPVLSIQPPAGSRWLPIETRVHLDEGTQGVRLDTTCGNLLPDSRYNAVVHFGGRGGDITVTVTTGGSAT